VSANDFTTNPDAAVHSIYQALGLAVRDEFAAYLSQVKKHQKARERGYDYDDVILDGFDDYDAFVRDIAMRSNTELQSQISDLFRISLLKKSSLKGLLKGRIT